MQTNKKSFETKKGHDRVLEISFKRVRDLPFKVFHKPKLSSSANHRKDFEPPSKKIPSYAPAISKVFEFSVK